MKTTTKNIWAVIFCLVVSSQAYGQGFWSRDENGQPVIPPRLKKIEDKIEAQRVEKLMHSCTRPATQPGDITQSEFIILYCQMKPDNDPLNRRQLKLIGYFSFDMENDFREWCWANPDPRLYYIVMDSVPPNEKEIYKSHEEVQNEVMEEVQRRTKNK